MSPVDDRPIHDLVTFAVSCFFLLVGAIVSLVLSYLSLGLPWVVAPIAAGALAAYLVNRTYFK